jgi:hypothetical protein
MSTNVSSKRQTSFGINEPIDYQMHQRLKVLANETVAMRKCRRKLYRLTIDGTL